MKKLLVIVGPTGTGKTKLAIKLAKEFNGEIVSADSRQIYKGMDIGTGKGINLSSDQVTEKKEGFWIVDGIPIHLYDLVTPDKTFSVAEYQQLAYKKIDEIHGKNKSLRDLPSSEVKLPILVGGTGLYIRAVVQGLKIPQVPPDKKIRERLGKRHLSQLSEELEEVDPKAYQKIDKSNRRRVIRALEVFYKTGKPISSLQKKYQPNFEALRIGLTAPRDFLYQKTDARIDSWIKHGFVEEVKTLLKKYPASLPSMSSLGYRQAASYLQKKISLEEGVRRIKFDHHGFIRRQLTWFRQEPNINWFDISQNFFEKEVFRTVREWLEN